MRNGGAHYAVYDYPEYPSYQPTASMAQVSSLESSILWDAGWECLSTSKYNTFTYSSL